MTIKIKIEDVDVSEFTSEDKSLQEAKANMGGGEVQRNYNASGRGVASSVKKIMSANDGKIPSFAVTEITGEKLSALRKSIALRTAGKLLISNIFGVIEGVRAIKGDKWFLVKFNLRDAKGANQILVKSTDASTVKNGVQATINKFKK